MRFEKTTYEEVLKKAGRNRADFHLLLGNGFNIALGVDTKYKNIFERMKINNPIYSQIESELKGIDYDIEILMGKLGISLQQNKYKDFLPGYTRGNIKFDFMVATIYIVKKAVKQAYSKSHAVRRLLENFTDYFTLNYDPFLYSFLVHLQERYPKLFRIGGEQFEQELQQSEREDFTAKPNQEILKEIKNARKEGAFRYRNYRHTLSEYNQTTNVDVLKKLLKESGYSIDDINYAFDFYFSVVVKNLQQNTTEEEESSEVPDVTESTKSFLEKPAENPINLFDGFNSALTYKLWRTQNLFFLHGAFHIYEQNGLIKKIKQTHDKTLVEKLEETIIKNAKDIICVFEADNTAKMKYINGNHYLEKANKILSEIGGSLVIIGSSLADNDKHIFDQIKNSQVKDVYISCPPFNTTKFQKIKRDALKFLIGKDLHFFDYNEINFESLD